MSNPIAKGALDDIPSASLSRFFSTKLLRELAISPKAFSSKLDVLSCRTFLPNRASISDFYERALDSLIRKDRSEYVYKNAIAQKLLLGRHSINSAALFFEFRVGQSKLDALLVNGCGHAFEIKTSQDELRRLDTQISDYQKIFTKVSVFTSSKHLERVRDTVPREIGISVLSQRYHISILRRPQKRVRHLDMAAMTAALRKEELVLALRELGISIPPVPNTLIRSEALRLSNSLTPSVFQSAMLRQLRRRFAVQQMRAAEVLPRSLTAAGLGLSLSERRLNELVRHLQLKLGDL